MDLVRYRVLGPLAAVRGSEPCALGGVRQQMVLAVLLANCNSLVSQDALVEAVWDGHPPAAARTSLHSYISNLRRELGNHQIGHSGHGYRVEVDEATCDALRLRQLARQGHAARATDAMGSLVALEEALQLWRGPPYGDLGDHPALVPEVTRLNELRLSVEEDRIECYLIAGAHDRVIDRLQALVAEQPYRERFQAQLMLALYRSGRQAEALQVFKDSRRRLVEELGVDPSIELWRLEEQILRHDPAIEAPRATHRETREPRPTGPLMRERHVTGSNYRPTRPNRLAERNSVPGGHRPASRARRGALVSVLLVGLIAISALVELSNPGLLAAWSPFPQGCAPPPPGLTAWWTGDNTTGDEIGRRDATLVNGATFGAGAVNQGFVLDGSQAFVEVSDDPSIDAGTGDFTVDLWVNFNETEGEQVLVEKWVQGSGGASAGWTIPKMSDNSFGFFQEGRGEQSPGVASSTIDIFPNTWLHVAARRSGETITILVDGTVQAVHGEEDVRVDVDSDSSLKFGHRGGNTDTPGANEAQGFYLNGKIDEVHLTIGRALTDQEIRAIVEAGDRGLCRPGPSA